LEGCGVEVWIPLVDASMHGEPSGPSTDEGKELVHTFSFFDGYRILLPWRVVPGFTLDCIFLIAVFVAVGITVFGLVMRKEK